MSGAIESRPSFLKKTWSNREKICGAATSESVSDYNLQYVSEVAAIVAARPINLASSAPHPFEGF
ncbi:hypothetical protein [Methylosinus sp. Ce-a6]|uniref:hypothetical protein n=1 Tax=Methylosinus sp. Ce-a6 TaxID=2172005 RepID=UPI00135C9B95|nr:hypothetical protein [Methylosinus sp. Ce-a6]